MEKIPQTIYPILNVLFLAPPPCMLELQTSFLFLNMYLVPSWQSRILLGAAPVISQEEYDSHSQPRDCGARAPGGASLLGRLFQGADRLTLKVWCYPQTCHFIQKKQHFRCLVVLFQREKQVRKPRVILELFVLCLPFDHTSLSCVYYKQTRILVE